MASTPVQRSVTKINPMFPIPEGTDEFEYGDVNANITSEQVEFSEAPIEDEAYADSSEVYDSPMKLETPTILSIVSQTIRRGPGGNNVVDLVLEIEGGTGPVQSYEFRVAKT